MEPASHYPTDYDSHFQYEGTNGMQQTAPPEQHIVPTGNSYEVKDQYQPQFYTNNTEYNEDGRYYLEPTLPQGVQENIYTNYPNQYVEKINNNDRQQVSEHVSNNVSEHANNYLNNKQVYVPPPNVNYEEPEYQHKSFVLSFPNQQDSTNFKHDRNSSDLNQFQDYTHPASVEKKNKSTYKYFPTDQGRVTNDFNQKNGLRAPRVSYWGSEPYDAESKQWQMDMLENQRLRLMLKSLGKAVEEYAMETFKKSSRGCKCQSPRFSDELITIEKVTKPEQEIAVLCRGDTDKDGLSQCNHSVACIHKNGRHVGGINEINHLHPNKITTVNVPQFKHHCNKQCNIEVQAVHHSHNKCSKNCKEITIEYDKRGKNDYGLRDLYYQRQQLMREKERLERRLCFQLEDRGAESKRRGFSRAVQYPLIQNK